MFTREEIEGFKRRAGPAPTPKVEIELPREPLRIVGWTLLCLVVIALLVAMFSLPGCASVASSEVTGSSAELKTVEEVREPVTTNSITTAPDGTVTHKTEIAGPVKKVTKEGEAVGASAKVQGGELSSNFHSDPPQLDLSKGTGTGGGVSSDAEAEANTALKAKSMLGAGICICLLGLLAVYAGWKGAGGICLAVGGLLIACGLYPEPMFWVSLGLNVVLAGVVVGYNRLAKIWHEGFRTHEAVVADPALSESDRSKYRERYAALAEGQDTKASMKVRIKDGLFR